MYLTKPYIKTSCLACFSANARNTEISICGSMIKLSHESEINTMFDKFLVLNIEQDDIAYAIDTNA